MKDLTPEMRANLFARLKEQNTGDQSLGVACAKARVDRNIPYTLAKTCPEWRALVESFRRPLTSVYGVRYMQGTKRAAGGGI